MEREDEIRAIAYRIWEEGGRRDGQDFDCWLTAEAIWNAQQKNKTGSTGDEAESKQTGSRGTHRTLVLKMLGH